MSWHVIASEADIETLRDWFRGFHDSCLREVHVWRDIFVDEQGIMHNAVQAGTHARLLFQRQDVSEPQAVELWFAEVSHVQIVQIPLDYEQYISVATLIKHGDLYYWADSPDWTPSPSQLVAWDTSEGYLKGPSMWIGAKQLRWRDASEWLGDTLRYGTAPK